MSAALLHAAAVLALTALPEVRRVAGLFEVREAAAEVEVDLTWDLTPLEEASPQLEARGQQELAQQGLPAGVEASGGLGAAADARLAAVGLSRSRVPAEVELQGSQDGEPASEAGEPRRTDPARPQRGRLSLSQLGVGRGVTQGWMFPEGAPRKRAGAGATKRRLDRALRQGAHEADRRKGLGAAGPVVTALQYAARQSDVDARSRAVFVITADSSGRVSSLSILSATGKQRAWHRAAAQARRQLAKRRLKVPKGAKGVSLRVEVSSRVQLPSGADPGLGVSVAGIPIKKGKGPRSTHLELLVPTLTGDLSDIGAEEIRVVSARVLSETVL